MSPLNRKIILLNICKFSIEQTSIHNSTWIIIALIYQVEEEEKLIEELKKIELRKKEREKKTQDLQKLITAADSNIDSRKADKKKSNKKFQQQQKVKDTTAVS